ncbi:hypothetical protein ACFYVC_07810 [Streptomyces tendae]|uniref:hypothetical protein n=1 Tax=Streptomyces tendae TaxID=1932 RepID=UPI0036C19C51
MSDVHVVGVHGIRQRDTNAIKLAEDWKQALAEGIALHIGPAVAAPAVTTPYYGNVFPKGRLQLGDEEVTDDLAGADEEEIALLIQALEAHTPPSLDEQPTAGTLGAPPRVSPRITGALARIDRKFGPRAGKMVVRRLSEAYGYFSSKPKYAGMAQSVRGRVRKALDETGATLVIAHSLGSVVIYDMFQRSEIPLPADGGVRQLITCGSPLAWLPLQRELGLRIPEKLHLPSDIDWLNVFDPYDPVTAGTGLAAVAPGATDVAVDNRDDPHASGRYLEQRVVAIAVHAYASKGPALPET